VELVHEAKLTREEKQHTLAYLKFLKQVQCCWIKGGVFDLLNRRQEEKYVTSQELLCKQVAQFSFQSSQSNDSNGSAQLLSMMQEQNQIGWQHFF
jgi:hypothetical protein